MNVATDELMWLDATDQAALVERGEVSSRELLDAAIARIDRLNPAVNAVIARADERARRTADRPLPPGPFRGVPFLVKDALATTAGDPFHFGMRVLKAVGWTEPDDSWLVQRLRAAGFVVCGKTNVPEMASTITTEPLAHGPTRNPWDLDRSAGGSSGGSAAAVASGMVAAAHGNDMGGSIRFPASMCGVVGLKPTRARTSLGPAFGEYWGPITHEGVLTRSVRDTARILDCVQGPGIGDPYTAPPPARPFADEVGADPGRLRIGLRTARPQDGGACHPDCADAVASAGRLLEELGHDVVPAEFSALDDPGLSAGIGASWPAVIAHEVDRWSARIGREIETTELEPLNAFLREAGRSVTASQYLGALETLQRWSRLAARWWADGKDVLVLPTSPEPPVPLGQLGGPNIADGGELLLRTAPFLMFTAPWNITGQPAISLPLHWNAEGLPIGVQLIAAHGREDILLRVAAQLETAAPWTERRPHDPPS